MPISIYQVDTFTDTLFRGNPAAVCPLEQWLPDSTLQAIAAENNLSETVFFIPNGRGTYHIRWFTPAVEVDLCGHATLAAAHILYTRLEEASPTLHFDSKSGPLITSRDKDYYILDFPADLLEEVVPPKVLLKALDISPTAVFSGREDYLLIVDDAAQVAQLAPDFGLLRQVRGRGVIVSAPAGEDGVDFVSRCFFPNAGIDEDPVTGSAHTTMTPYWAERLGKQELVARQISERGGEIRCTMLGERVVLAGQAVTYLKGEIYV